MTNNVAGELVAGVVAHGPDLSILGLIGSADLVVKFVLLILLASSIWSWAIIIDKFILFRQTEKQNELFEKVFWSGQLLDQLYERIRNKAYYPLSVVFVAAMDEWSKQKSASHNSSLSYLSIGLKERIMQAMDTARNKEIDRLEKNLSFLAIVASSATFVGLFGTVWGIMNSFQSIAMAKNATIAVVAPSIAEALFATAIGLVAAVPASIFYSFLTTKINNISSKVDDFSNELGSLLSQEIDRGINHGSSNN